MATYTRGGVKFSPDTYLESEPIAILSAFLGSYRRALPPAEAGKECTKPASKTQDTNVVSDHQDSILTNIFSFIS